MSHERNNWKRKHDNTGRTDRYAGATVANLRIPEESQKILINWFKSPSNFLVLVGAPGSGKTYCAHAIMKDIGLLPQVLYRRLWTESEFIGKVKSTFDTYGTPEKEIEYICDDDLIVFDDFGSTSPGEWKQEILFHFVNIRYISKKPTIITTNLYENDMREKLGHRTSSRMFSSSNTIINFGDADLRKDPEIG